MRACKRKGVMRKKFQLNYMLLQLLSLINQMAKQSPSEMIFPWRLFSLIYYFYA